MSANVLPLTQLQRRPIDKLLTGLRSTSAGESLAAAQTLLSEAKSYGLGVRDYLMLATEVPSDMKSANLNGYEAALAYLKLPIKNDFKNGMTLQLAGETFQTFPGTRMLFPPVIDDMVNWAYRQDLLEQVAPMVSQSRTISGVELISTTVDDAAGDYQVSTVAEGSRVPVKSIRMSESSVKFFKHGMGWRTTYEFSRRASLDILTPYANRTIRAMEQSKVRAATDVLVNGDGVNAAAGVVNQSTLATRGGFTHTNNTLNYRGVLVWLTDRAKAGTPVDTIVGNWDAYLQWQFLFAIPVANAGPSGAEALAKAGVNLSQAKSPTLPVKFAVSSSAPDNKLIGFSKGDTLEELVEANSLISESEQSILNQTVTYIRTENSGFKLALGDTRSILNYGA